MDNTNPWAAVAIGAGVCLVLVGLAVAGAVIIWAIDGYPRFWERDTDG